MRVSAASLVQVTLSLLATGIATNALSIKNRATVCNGHAELCDRGYGNVTFVGAHNSYAVGVNNLAANQDHDVTQQLNDGVRLLQMQAHDNNGVIQLCHTLCSLYNGGTLADYLVRVKTWMDANPNDVVTLLIVNSDNLPPSQYDAVFRSAGLDTMSYSPPSASLPQSGWPTMGSLIDEGKRLVTFLSTKADFTAVPYLIDEFSNIWETAFDVTDTTFDCNVNRTSGDPSTQMYLINHFLDKVVLGVPVPDVDKANQTNAATGVGSLGQQVSTCVTDHGRYPNFLLVDFYEYGGGSVFQVAAAANGVTYSPATPVATPLPQGSTSTSASSGSNGSNTNGAAGSFGGVCASLTLLGGALLGALTLL